MKIRAEDIPENEIKIDNQLQSLVDQNKNQDDDNNNKYKFDLIHENFKKENLEKHVSNDKSLKTNEETKDKIIIIPIGSMSDSEILKLTIDLKDKTREQQIAILQKQIADLNGGDSGSNSSATSVSSKGQNLYMEMNGI